MSKEHYETSRVFGILKAKKDSLEGNLTTSQYLETLDRYLNSALQAILKNTRYLESMVASLIGWQEENYRRRVSLLTKREFLPRALTWLLMSKAEKMRDLHELKLDRGVALLICHAFLSECSEYSRISKKSILDENTDLKVIHDTKARLLVPGGNLNHALATVRYQSELAADYRGAILSKYFRLSIMAAQRDYVSYFNCRISLDDMCSEYIMASARAIDKCDYEKGPLTTHVQSWFYTARSHCKKRYDTGLNQQQLSDDVSTSTSADDSHGSYADTGGGGSVSQDGDDQATATRRNGSYSGTSVGLDDAMVSSENSNTIRFLAKIADPTGIARRRLGIEEILSIAEKKQLGLKDS
jgi:hypothetical protein